MRRMTWRECGRTMPDLGAGSELDYGAGVARARYGVHQSSAGHYYRCRGDEPGAGCVWCGSFASTFVGDLAGVGFWYFGADWALAGPTTWDRAGCGCCAVGPGCCIDCSGDRAGTLATGHIPGWHGDHDRECPGASDRQGKPRYWLVDRVVHHGIRARSGAWGRAGPTT